ncbi:MAG: hypothetical protein BMS9Abin21_016 [Thermodesulfovibrionia bacterium]|nr:MAG: hypothetical protein BMS9Abin21_016 [Thermodesulfovibrionia bacterium]
MIKLLSIVVLVIFITVSTAYAQTSSSERQTRPSVEKARPDVVRAMAVKYIGYYKSIKLTPEQEKIKVIALSSLPAPCCSDNSVATCCCPCNLAKSTWGLSSFLIAERGYNSAQVRQAAIDWFKLTNPNGYSGSACYTGGCSRAFNQNGCGGMNDKKLS